MSQKIKLASEDRLDSGKSDSELWQKLKIFVPNQKPNYRGKVTNTNHIVVDGCQPRGSRSHDYYPLDYWWPRDYAFIRFKNDIRTSGIRESIRINTTT